MPSTNNRDPVLDLVFQIMFLRLNTFRQKKEVKTKVPQQFLILLRLSLKVYQFGQVLYLFIK